MSTTSTGWARTFERSSRVTVSYLVVGVYLFAGLVGLLSGAAALLIPLWRRGGLPEIRRQSSWLVPLFAGLVIFVVAIMAANHVGFGNAVDLGLGVGSVVVALLWLRRNARVPLSPTLRLVLWLVTVFSVVLVLFAIKNVVVR